VEIFEKKKKRGENTREEWKIGNLRENKKGTFAK